MAQRIEAAMAFETAYSTSYSADRIADAVRRLIGDKV